MRQKESWGEIKEGRQKEGEVGRRRKIENQEENKRRIPLGQLKNRELGGK